MKPVSEKAMDGRVSPKGIPCLYLASDEKTAALEVRPLIGSYVSLAKFEVLRNIRVVDCSHDNMDVFATPEDVETAVWSDINKAFSEPVERGDNSLDYVPTQILAEAFKRHGFDGIAQRGRRTGRIAGWRPAAPGEWRRLAG